MPRPPAQKGRARTAEPSVVREIPVTPHFNKAFYATGILTGLFVVIAATLALVGNDSKATNEVIKSCLTMATFGFGTIAGLLGGKAL